MERPDEEIWAFPGPDGSNCLIEWVFQDSAPLGVRAGRDLIAANDPSLRLFNMPVSEKGTAFPHEFVFDPASGERLSRPSTNVLVSSFPNLSISGFPLLPSRSRHDHWTKIRLNNVPNGAQCFFAAGNPAYNFCITEAGDLYFRTGPDNWIFLERLAKPAGHPFSIGVVAYSRGFATVLSGTAVIAEIVDGFPKLLKKTLRVDGGSLCGPPSMLERDVVAFPVKRGDTFSLARYDTAKRAWLEEIVAEGPAIDCDEGLSAPIQSSSSAPDVFWIGRNGYLVLTSELGTRLARIQLFAEGITAAVGVPPLKDERDTVYALARTAKHYCYVSLSSHARTIELEGPHIAVGRGRYIGRDYYPSLWNDEVVTLQIEAGTGRLLLPLAFTANVKGATDGALLVLAEGVSNIDELFSLSGDKWFSGSLYWHSGSQLHPLHITLRFRSRFDILVLPENDGLIVGSALTNDFYRLEQ
jgi:hypothetical protein